MKRSERFPSRYVKAADLKPGGATVVIDHVEMEPVGQGKDQQTKPVIYFKNASKTLVLNSVNDETLGTLFGDDDKNWRGERVVLYPTTTTFGGKTVPCIRVRAADDGGENENPAPPEDDVPPDFDDEIPF